MPATFAVPPSSARLLLTPDPQRRLVAAEAVRAFTRLGWSAAPRPEADLGPQALARLFALPPQRSNLPAHPSLFFCVNFHGLDRHGESFSRFEAAGVPVAVWAVDNPWNLLAGMRNDFWKRAWLFVTDPSFIPGLREHGARHVTYLPLGTDPALFSPPPPGSPPPEQIRGLKPVVFAGRSHFPDKERFFVGQSVDPALLAEAEHALADGGRPDFFWWQKRLIPEPCPALWPGSAARRISFGAEESSARWRPACLRAASGRGLTLFGDEGWRDHFPPDMAGAPDLRPPVDYYGSLGRIYHAAEFSLAMTSLLLPQGLNQRHFDVWAAGGFCLTDATPGLDLFPPELTGPVTFVRPEDIGGMIRRFRDEPAEKTTLARTWREHVLSHHTYGHRIQTLLAEIFSFPANLR